MKTNAPTTRQLGLAWRGTLLAAILLAACSKSVAAPDEEVLTAPPRPHDTRTFAAQLPGFLGLPGATAY